MDIAVQERTLGDGMDNLLMTSAEISTRININGNSANVILQSAKPVEPKSPIVTLIPKYVPKQRKPNHFLRKQKEPKFIPYEPYKCAIQPIVPKKQRVLQEVSKSKYSRNNVDINHLVEQMSELRSSEVNKAKIDAIQSDDGLISRKQWEEEKTALVTDIKNLRETNAHLENQLKFQAQVNRELKTLLVAAVGEDLETRVQHLTEDKLQLARALLNSANHLTSHQEQTEWLSGQCEVWRSKFLASSLMVEELARWKSALTKRVTELQDSMKCLLDESNKTYSSSIKTHLCLLDIHGHLEKSKKEMILSRIGNYVELADANASLSENIRRVLNVENNLQIPGAELLPTKLEHTLVERLALQLLQNPVSLPNKPDAVCSALLGTARSVSGGQLYLQHPNAHATCCAHCMGEVQEL